MRLRAKDDDVETRQLEPELNERIEVYSGGLGTGGDDDHPICIDNGAQTKVDQIILPDGARPAIALVADKKDPPRERDRATCPVGGAAADLESYLGTHASPCRRQRCFR